MISQESDEVKLLFIEEALSLHGEWLCDILVEAIEKNKLRRTDALLDSINYDNGNPGLRFSFFGYGRAVDMTGYKRNKHEVDTMHDIKDFEPLVRQEHVRRLLQARVENHVRAGRAGNRTTQRHPRKS